MNEFDNDIEYFTRYMVTKTNLLQIKKQQQLYVQLYDYLLQCNGDYRFYESYLNELKSFYQYEKYVNSSHDFLNKNLETIEIILENIPVLSQSIEHYMDKCAIPIQLDLIEHLLFLLTF